MMHDVDFFLFVDLRLKTSIQLSSYWMKYLLALHFIKLNLFKSPFSTINRQNIGY